MRAAPAGPGDAEVGDLHPALVVDDDVLRLDVAVDDVLAMREAQRLEDLHGDRDQQCSGRSGAYLTMISLSGPPLEVLHGDVVGALGLAPVVDLDDVGVVEAGRAARLAAEALHELLVVRVVA